MEAKPLHNKVVLLIDVARVAWVVTVTVPSCSSLSRTSRFEVWETDTPHKIRITFSLGCSVSIISFSHVTFSYPTTDVLTNVSFTCGTDERLCVVGPNGSGKTTLLKLALGELTPLRGHVDTPLSWDNHAPPTTVGDVIDAACHQVLKLRHEFDMLSHQLAFDVSAETARRFDELLARMTAMNGWELDTQLDKTLRSLGLGNIARDRPLNSLSPGQQERLHLAAVLLRGSPALVVDEPTNHLDTTAREFVIQTLTGWNGPVLFASHDRDFIDRAATGILDLDTTSWHAIATAAGQPTTNGIYRCNGTYSDYVQEKDTARSRHLQIHAHQQHDKQQLLQHRFSSETIGHRNATPRSEVRASKKYYADRAQTVSTRRINDDSRRLDRLTEVEVRKPRYDVITITFPDPTVVSTGIACSVRNVHIPGRLGPVSFELAGGEHMMITGVNGAGKSTLLRWIHTRQCLAAEASGTISAADSVFVPQELPRNKDELIPPEIWHNGIGDLGKGFLHPKLWATPLEQLSDGNKRRVQLALALAQQPEFLIIDEPTNYLDIDTIESLEAAIMSWHGTLIIATHDQWLIDTWNQAPADGEPHRQHITLTTNVASSQ